jgi:flavin-dependent dehydrogenase
VLLLEKKKFPRQKICGDAVCTQAQDIMEQMQSATGKGSVLDEILRESKGHPAANGGLVSPSGYSYIGNSVGEAETGKLTRSAVIAIKRIVLDEKLARSAAYAGAKLMEEVSVEDARFNIEGQFWEIYGESASGAPGKPTFQARVLVCADGAPSRLAMHLGIVKDAPQGTCSRAYVKAGTHNYGADGTVIYNKDLLPGYMAIFREVNDELNYCCYIIPGNPAVRNEDLSRLHHGFMKDDFYLSRALGPKADLEPMKAGSLRLGGVARSYANHLLIVGDAAGFIDPLTGEGIHHGMDSGVMAAEVLVQAFEHSDFSARFLSNYQRRWMRAFGYDFKASMRLAQVLYRFPILLDAATLCIEKEGDDFLAEWARIMTGQRPKSQLFRPYIMFAMAKELVYLAFLRTFGLEKRPIDEIRKRQ